MVRPLHSLLCITFIVFSVVQGRPQTDSDNSLSRQDGSAFLSEEAYDDKIDYTLLGDAKFCGFSSKDIGRVAPDGGQAQRRDWPWMAVLLDKVGRHHFCGGAVITSKHILTASHCTYRRSDGDFIVRLGEYDLSRDDDTLTREYEVAEVRNHEDWDPSTYENDVSVLLLAERILYNMYIQPVCLPLPGQDFTNTTAVVAGWGATSFGGPLSDVLLEVAVPVWEQEECVSSFSQIIFNTTQCAASHEGGKDSCQGDSGGPLLSQREDKRWITIGIVSWGINCAIKGQPGVYTRVNKYLDWIAGNIKDV